MGNVHLDKCFSMACFYVYVNGLVYGSYSTVLFEHMVKVEINIHKRGDQLLTLESSNQCFVKIEN